MCVVSNVGDYFGRTMPERYPWYEDWRNGVVTDVPRAEFDALKKEVEALRELLLAAKKFDEKTNQKDCEQADKIKLLRGIAALVGVNLDDIFENKPSAPR